LTEDVTLFVARAGPTTGPFDLLLLDPPYDAGADELERVLAGLGPDHLSDKGWTVVLTRGFKSSTPVIPVHWAIARQLRYGDSLVILYREVSWA
jgi:16S rRNA (guanine966-N2)-methyltransferase